MDASLMLVNVTDDAMAKTLELVAGAGEALERKDVRDQAQKALDANDKKAVAEWRTKICAAFQAILVEEIIDDPEMSTTRRLLHEFRMETDPNGLGVMCIYIDRVRRAPRCFAMQFMADLWSEVRTFGVLLQVNYLGLHSYTPSETPLLMCSFRYVDSLVSWLSLNDMLTVHVVHKATKRSAKLHFLTREAMQVKTMLTRYSEAVLQELKKIDKEKELREKLKLGA